MPEELKQLYEELHQASRQFLRFNGVDKERAEKYRADLDVRVYEALMTFNLEERLSCLN